ncbi:MAG: PaaI family thioesterase [Dehalococcoidia bacterium]|mgnify:CR=1 FL=1|nr:PaaI family thioesterase [Dehalococcoidia bacterium]
MTGAVTPGFDALRAQWQDRPFLTELGVSVDVIEEGYARLTMSRNDIAVGGIRDSINGGVVASLAELAAEIALSSTLGPGESIVSSVDVGLSYLTSALGDPTVAEGRVLRKGGRLCVCDVEVSDGENGAMNAKARVSFAIVRPPRDA